MSVSNIFETLMVTGVAPGLDNQQTALAVQALLESQSIPETTQPVTIDEDDLFQCGKCKKQFNNISLFVSHKQAHCVGLAVQNVQNVQNVASLASLGLRSPTTPNVSQQGAAPSGLTTKQLPGYSAVPSSPLAQALGHNIVLTDDLINFTTTGEGAAPSGSLQVGSNPFLSQVSPTHSSAQSSSATTLLVSTAATLSGYTSTAAIPASCHTVPLTATPTMTYTSPDGVILTTDPAPQLSAAQLTTQLGPPPTQPLGHGALPTAAQILPTAAQIMPTAAQIMPTGLGNKAQTLPSLLRAATAATVGSRVPRKLTSVTLSNGQIAMISEDDLTLTPAPAPPPQAPPPQTVANQAPAPAAPPPQATPPTKARRTKPVPEEPSGKRKLKCQYCDKTFAKNFDLQQHVRSHTGEKPFQCIVCGRAFAQKSNVKKHMQTHKVWPQGTGKTLPIQPPPKIISTQEEGSEKTEIHDDGTNVPPANTIEVNLKKKPVGDSGSPPVKVNVVIDSSYMCQYCPTKCKSYFQLKSHMLQHKAEQVYKCVVKSCNMTFGELDHFLEHTKAHEEDMNYRCHMCSKVFASLYELGVHQYSHSLYPNQGPKPGPRYFRCVKCNCKYSTSAALQHHLDTVSHKHPCPHCHKIFTCERYLRRHLPIHGSTGPHTCDTCQKQFKTEHYLKVHQLTHSSERPFSCEFCLAAFNRRDKLKRHMLVHEATKKYKCPFRGPLGCTKEFNRPDKLKAHIICHSGIKPYKCKECGKTFTRRPNLRQHERGHRKDWSHSCATCGKGFLRERLFKLHKCRPLAPNAKAGDFIPTELTPKETTNRRLFKALRGQVIKRGSRPRRATRPGQTKPDPEPVVPDAQYDPATIQEAGEIQTITYPASGEPGEISVVLEPAGTDAKYLDAKYDIGAAKYDVEASVAGTTVATTQQYQTQDIQPPDGSTAVITAEDGNVVVIQSLGQVPNDFSALPPGSYSEPLKPEEPSQTPASVGGPEELRYSLEYPSSVYQTAYSGQNTTFITAAGHNMATFVVEGPGGEVLTQENILVATGTDGYNVLEYPMATDDDQGQVIMANGEMVAGEMVAGEMVAGEMVARELVAGEIVAGEDTGEVVKEEGVIMV